MVSFLLCVCFYNKQGNFLIFLRTVFGVGVRRCGVGALEVLSQSTDPGSKSKDRGGAGGWKAC